MAGDALTLIELLRSPQSDIDRIIPAFVSRFNAAYGDPRAVTWDITKEEWQRYEFLGDRVISLVVAQALFVHRDAVLDEGAMSVILADLVSNRSLDAMMRESGACGLLIPAAIGAQGSYGERITAGAFEAFIGALYCEVGIDDVAFFVTALLARRLEDPGPRHNAKGLLQEYFQKRGLPLPVYTGTERTGPSHKPVFTIRLTLPDGRSFEGTGPAKAEAEKAAAARALEAIGRDV